MNTLTTEHILFFSAGFLVASIISGLCIYALINQHLNDLMEVKEAGRKQGYAEGTQRRCLTAFAPTETP